jgi:energy-coupling factor transporter transmembrane protein EcfT
MSPLPFAYESDRQLTAGALRLYAEDCRNIVGVGSTLDPLLTRAARQAERLADEILQIE